MGRLMTIYINKTMTYLEQQGKKIITEAVRTKETQNDTYNQYDAYGYLVYYNGVLKRWSLSPELSYGEKHKGWDKYGIPAATGSEWANIFKADFEPPKSGFALVVFNAAFYSRILEEGTQNNRNGQNTTARKFRILSQVVGSLKDIQSKFNNARLTGINIDVG